MAKETKQALRQLEILSKYHEVDYENKIVRVCLHYEKASDIVSENLGSKDKPVFERDIIEKMSDILNTFPQEYKLDLELQINDYEGYNPNVLLSSLTDTFELEHYRTQRQVKKTSILVMILLFIGVGLLLLLNVLKSTNVIGESLKDLVLDYFLDTAACVFMWEAVSQLFIYPAEFVTTNLKVFHLFSKITFSDSNGNLLSSIDKDSLFKDLVDNDGKKKLGNIFLITTGSAHIIIGLISLVNFFVEINKIEFNRGQILFYIITVIIVSVIQIIYGIGSVNRYREKGPFQKLVFVFSFVLIALYGVYIVSLILAAINGMTLSAAIIVSLAIGVIATTMNLIGCIFTRPKKDKK